MNKLIALKCIINICKKKAIIRLLFNKINANEVAGQKLVKILLKNTKAKNINMPTIM